MKLTIKYMCGTEQTIPIIDFWYYKNCDDDEFLGYYLKVEVGLEPRHYIRLNRGDIEEISIKEFDT